MCILDIIIVNKLHLAYMDTEECCENPASFFVKQCMKNSNPKSGQLLSIM